MNCLKRFRTKLLAVTALLRIFLSIIYSCFHLVSFLNQIGDEQFTFRLIYIFQTTLNYVKRKHSKVKHNKWGTVGGGICPFTIPGMFVICLGSMKAVKLSTKNFEWWKNEENIFLVNILCYVMKWIDSLHVFVIVHKRNHSQSKQMIENWNIRAGCIDQDHWGYTCTCIRIRWRSAYF